MDPGQVTHLEFHAVFVAIPLGLVVLAEVLAALAHCAVAAAAAASIAQAVPSRRRPAALPGSRIV